MEVVFVVGGYCCWRMLEVVVVESCCCWRLLLLEDGVVVGSCWCWRLLLWFVGEVYGAVELVTQLNSLVMFI